MALSFTNIPTSNSGMELTEHGTPLFPIGCYHDHLIQNPVPWHWHEEFEAGIVLCGRAVLRVGSESAILNPGDGFFVNTNVLHTVESLRDSSAPEEAALECELHSMSFHGRLLGGFDSIFQDKYVRPIIGNPDVSYIVFHRDINWEKQSVDYIERAWLAVVEEPAAFENETRYALTGLFYHLTEHLSQASLVRSAKSIRVETRLKTMLSFIHAHYSEEITLKQIGESASISESEALRCFKEAMSTTPIQYVRSYRLQMAASMLKEKNRGISEIGFACGFSDMSYFSKEFRKMYGCTPSAYSM